MLITNICNAINQALAGEVLTKNELTPHIDYAIDTINATLNSCFPALSELDTLVTDYNYFPSNYIRLVVVPGAAWHFYVNDEEGMQTATQYQTEFEKGLFLMLRDYATQVPELYQVTAVTQGSIKGNDDNYAVGDWGISVVQGLY